MTDLVLGAVLPRVPNERQLVGVWYVVLLLLLVQVLITALITIFCWYNKILPTTDGLACKEEELQNLVKTLETTLTAYGMEISSEKNKARVQ